jgi:hypothetical protein
MPVRAGGVREEFRHILRDATRFLAVPGQGNQNLVWLIRHFRGKGDYEYSEDN